MISCWESGNLHDVGCSHNSLFIAEEAPLYLQQIPYNENQFAYFFGFSQWNLQRFWWQIIHLQVITVFCQPIHPLVQEIRCPKLDKPLVGQFFILKKIKKNMWILWSWEITYWQWMFRKHSSFCWIHNTLVCRNGFQCMKMPSNCMPTSGFHKQVWSVIIHSSSNWHIRHHTFCIVDFSIHEVYPMCDNWWCDMLFTISHSCEWRTVSWTITSSTNFTA